MSKSLKAFLVTTVIFIIAAIQYLDPPAGTPQPDTPLVGRYTSDDILKNAFETKQSNLQVRGYGRVKKLLPDDNQGSRHQRFILSMDSGQSLLVAHNIDLAKKITDLRVNDLVEFYGVYEWNGQGGVIHWTHHDPDQSHIDGWLKHAGKTYQ